MYWDCYFAALMWIWSFAIIVVTLFGFVSLYVLCYRHVMIFLDGWFINGVLLTTECLGCWQVKGSLSGELNGSASLPTFLLAGHTCTCVQVE